MASKIECPVYRCRSKKLKQIRTSNKERLNFVCEKCGSTFSVPKEYYDVEQTK